MDLAGFLGQRSKPFLVTSGFLLVLLVGLIDHATGPAFSVSIFYLLPIALAAWFAGRAYAVLISTAGAITWFLADLMVMPSYSHPAIHFWNAIVRLGSFLIVTYTLSALKGALDRLKDSHARISQFSADLAHELRTPINNLRGEAEVALSRSRTADEYREVLESSLEEYARLSRMIDSLLFLARAESPETQIERKWFGAREEIAGVRDFLDAIAEEQGVEVTCHGNELLNADPMLFRRAVSNLLTNALQHTPRGGKVCISVKKLSDASVEVSVSDTGFGIPPEHLPRIFDRFYRVNHARSQPKGMGLGLSIVKSIMDLHGGSVTIQSERGAGTIASLRFPPPAQAPKITKL